MHKFEQSQLCMKSLPPKNGLLWKATKKLSRYREKIPPLKQENGLLATSDKDKANILASKLADTFQSHPNIIPENDVYGKIHLFFSAPLPMSLS